MMRKLKTLINHPRNLTKNHTKNGQESLVEVGGPLAASIFPVGPSSSRWLFLFPAGLAGTQLYPSAVRSTKKIMDGGGGSKVECYIKGAGVFGTRKTMCFLFFFGVIKWK